MLVPGIKKVKLLQIRNVGLVLQKEIFVEENGLCLKLTFLGKEISYNARSDEKDCRGNYMIKKKVLFRSLIHLWLKGI